MPTDSFLEVKGGTVFVRQWRPASAMSGVPLVLLHDSLGCVDLWRDFPAVLAHRLSRSVVAYDRLGFGRSSERKELPGANFIQEEAEVDLPAVLAGLGITDFVVFGHSVGGTMALVTASGAGDSCKAVVSESAQAFVEARTIAGIQNAKTLFHQPEQFARLARWHGTKARWVLDAWTEVWLSPQFTSWNVGPDLPRVRCPVLAIHGDQDEYGSVLFPEFICKHVGGPAEMHILSGCGHVPHREREEEVTDLVARFLPPTTLA